MRTAAQTTGTLSLTNEDAIRAVNLSKTYTSGKLKYEALKDISFVIKKGEFAAILGPSGSGKSTILNLLGTLDLPTNGELFINGIGVSKMNAAELTKLRNKIIGFVFQSYNLIPYLTVEENVEMPAIAFGLNRSERKARARRLLDELGLQGKYAYKPKEISGGEQQRVAIARAFINEPAIVLADEPTGNLDSKSADRVITLLKEKSRDKSTTLIIVTHDEQLTKHCHRVIRINDGRVVSEVTR